MKKTKFQIDFISRGDLNDGIVRMITNHNEGNCQIDINIFEGWSKGKFAEWPTVSPKYSFFYSNDNTILQVFENNRATLIVELIEVYELDTVASNEEQGDEQ